MRHWPFPEKNTASTAVESRCKTIPGAVKSPGNTEYCTIFVLYFFLLKSFLQKTGCFLGADVGQDPGYFFVRHGVALGEVPHGGGEFSVRAAELGNDDLGHLRVGAGDLYRVL